MERKPERKLEDLIDSTNNTNLEGAVFGDSDAAVRIVEEIYQALIRDDLQGFTRLYLIHKLSGITGEREAHPDPLREPLLPERVAEIREMVQTRLKKLSEASGRSAGGYSLHRHPVGTPPDMTAFDHKREIAWLKRMEKAESPLCESYLVAVAVCHFGSNETAVEIVAALIGFDKDKKEEREEVELHRSMWGKLYRLEGGAHGS
jgi:hypothetical protein